MLNTKSLKDHPASNTALNYFNALYSKDAAAFSRQFNLNPDWPFLVVLPAGNQSLDVRTHVLMHEAWFSNRECSFNPLIERKLQKGPFAFEQLRYANLLSESVYQCGVDVHVIKQLNVGSRKSQAIATDMHMQIIFEKEKGLENWWPRFILNSRIDDLMPL